MSDESGLQSQSEEIIASLNPHLKESVQLLGFRHLTQIQADTFRPAMEGRDFIARSPTGTGKTAAFLIPLVERMGKDPTLKAVIIEPSRELAIQAANEGRKLAGASSVRIVAAYGGTPPKRQAELIKDGYQIVIGTPGRLHELLQKGVLKPSLFSILILDEADRLFADEFRKEVLHIASRIAKTRQTMLFSVQMPAEVLEMAAKLLKADFKKIKLGTAAAQTVRHYIVISDEAPRALAKLIGKNPVKSLVFANSAEEADELRKSFRFFGLPYPIVLHSGLDSQARHSAVRRFVQGCSESVLISTDLGARGMHFPDVKTVYSIGLPNTPSFYLHRSGRTGRMGKTGECVSIIPQTELKKMNAILSHCGITAVQKKAE
ncbi:DEAD/DEAH box helicase [Candidatus Micrarchaeota archaeon]|nr:DEAD/DEAH box helicase [Candidatus Micrarchaeota archaeon]MBI5176668.1 DEAD/DEAH box helicase [Candidatus Micrarchaeota archaeon]